ncbi:MAG: hypothetical protein O3C40_28220 [Planctomycetota bacterium]|nr:hypothetical protein [Planctomycetota bacterium]
MPTNLIHHPHKSDGVLVVLGCRTNLLIFGFHPGEPDGERMLVVRQQDTEIK